MFPRYLDRGERLGAVGRETLPHEQRASNGLLRPVPLASTNGIELMYESFGTGPTVVLVMGIASQMVLWDEVFCRQLADRGLRVVRFDNRDIGLSTKLTSAGVPELTRIVGRALLGLSVQAPYTLSDMAADVAGLLDHLEVDAAHIVGASMGGMIAQHMAIEAPTRVRSLTSIMSTPGALRHAFGVRPAALRAFLGPRPKTEEEGVTFLVGLYRVLNAGATPFPEEAAQARAREVIARSWHPAGFPRHLAAILASGDRTAALASIRAPTLVIHGEVDPLVPIAAGRATAAAIPNARFQAIPTMGHFLPPVVWDTLVDAIAEHALSAGEAAG